MIAKVFSVMSFADFLAAHKIRKGNLVRKPDLLLRIHQEFRIQTLLPELPLTQLHERIFLQVTLGEWETHYKNSKWIFRASKVLSDQWLSPKQGVSLFSSQIQWS